MKPSHFPKFRYTKRWFCYLDLLGFEKLVQTGELNQILPLYEDVLASLERATGAKVQQGISSTWFSDTFIIFSKTGHPKQFALLEQAGRLFFQELVLHRVPVRGAISYGDLYTQQERNIFIGPALVDAYRYGEGQNALGFLLTPSAVNAMEEAGLPASERLHYRKVQGSRALKPGVEGPAYAFAFNSGTVNGKNPFLAALREMQHQAGHAQTLKYENTLSFVRSA